MTIEQIEIEKTFYRRERDAFGNSYREPYQQKVKRKVKVVESGTRFGYFVIDSLIIGALQIGFGFLFIASANSGEPAVLPFINILTLFLSFGYYFLMEKFAHGQTVGKMALGYVAINKYAQPPTTSELLIRTVCRLIPFEAFSCLSDRGWHDKFSDTWVVSKEERDKLQKLLGGFAVSESDLLDQ